MGRLLQEGHPVVVPPNREQPKDNIKILQILHELQFYKHDTDW